MPRRTDTSSILKLDGGECTLATLAGYDAEDWVRLVWRDSNKLEIRYGLPVDEAAKGRAPELFRGEGACRGIEAAIVPDPALIPAPRSGGGDGQAQQGRNGS